MHARDALAVLERLPIPAYTLGRDETIVWLNAAAKELVGDMTGRRATLVLAPESRRTAREAFAQKLVGDAPSTDYEAVILRPDGSRVAVEISSVPAENDDRACVVFGVVLPKGDLPAFSGPMPELTPRQTEVLRHLANGRSTVQIADEMGVSTDTVRNHVRDLLKRLHVHSRLEAVVAAHAFGIA